MTFYKISDLKKKKQKKEKAIMFFCRIQHVMISWLTGFPGCMACLFPNIERYVLIFFSGLTYNMNLMYDTTLCFLRSLLRKFLGFQPIWGRGKKYFPFGNLKTFLVL